MNRRYTKDDVDQHSDRGPLRPAVNVKVSFPWGGWDKLAEQVARDNGEPEDIEAFGDYVDNLYDTDAMPDWLFEAACESGWEMLQSDAEDIFGSGVKVFSEGRSGGWAVVNGIPDLEDWDAIQLSKWRKFERYARMIADDIPYQMLALLLFNVWEPEQEAKRQCELAYSEAVLRSVGAA